MVEENAEFRGFTRAQIDTLFHRMDEFREILREHCSEEHRTWEKFEKAQEEIKLAAAASWKEINDKIDQIQQWRARVIGYASAIATIVGFALRWLYDKLR